MLGRADRELTAAEHYRLDAGPITAGHHRSGLLRTASGMVAAETSLVILPGRDPPARPRRPGRHRRPGRQDPGPARRAAAGPACPVPPRLPGRRRGDVAVQSSAVLALDGAKVAIATERITGDLCRLIATGSRALG